MKNSLLKILFWGIILTVSNSYAQSVSGTVTEENGTPIPGVNIIVKGTTDGTSTDFDGKYTIDNLSEGAILVFSSLSFKTQEILVNDQTTINVIMVSDTEALGEVVILGYGQVQNKKSVTSAVSTVSTEQIERVPIALPEAALQGTAPGIAVTQTSGAPGAPLTVRLRGTSSTGASTPLFLVDGQQVPNLNHINASDIESFSVLKDAASASIFGARGGNGVVLIETKSGKRNLAAPKVSIDGYTGFQSLLRKPDLMDKNQYVQYFNEFQASNGGTQLTDAEIAALPDTDWYDELFDTTPISNIAASVIGGGEKYSYAISGGIFQQDGMLGGRENKSNFDRKNVRINFETDIRENFNVEVNANLADIDRNFLLENAGVTGTSIINFINAMPAIYPVNDPNDPSVPFNPGNQTNPVVVNGVTLPALGAVANPELALLLNNNNTQTAVTNASIKGDWEIFDRFRLQGTYYHFNSDAFTKQFFPSFNFPTQAIASPNATLIETRTEMVLRQFDANVRYDFFQNSDHKLDALAGFSTYESDFSNSTLSGVGFFVNTLDEANFALITNPSSITVAPPVETENNLLGIYGKVKYSYMDKYNVEATLRADSSSNFGDDNRTGIFPSVSAGWVISEENFLQDSEVIDLLKLRASWGINGSDFIAPYQFSPILNAGSGTNFGGGLNPGLTPAFLQNPDVKWEEVAQTNIGLDINAFNNALGITIDYYNKQSSDVLIPIGIPIFSGFPAPATNIADVENQGFEFLVSYQQTYKSGFRWQLGANLAVNKNEVTSIGNNGQPLQGGNTFVFNDPITLTTEGEAISSFFGFEVESIDDDGNLVFRDFDGDGNPDKTFIGSPLPDFTYGITLDLEYKGFDLSTFLYGSQGNDIFDATLRPDGAFTNRKESFLTNGVVNRLGGFTPQVSDFFVQDGSFLKMKTLTLGYSLKESWVESIGLNRLRIYGTAQNLFLITDYDGTDPEIGEQASGNSLDLGIDRGFNPQPRTFLFGFQLEF
ncbi:SusC/RagA family TonB-linked outer membrane protein [Aquimarina spongiae]|uniref:TonB-linked outer membrane protein, SusC/RagA family n=1 Tax=Aquimarina spongiae TaxID=570521 RepID=A0A1M6HB16_9FLAO|nr:TonB-dependent receptor [Aquimarina spongiae]SHJ19309.1 TonB-linked outer membrane protein, SusC/RagA family [Aquimarina spongiae]